MTHTKSWKVINFQIVLENPGLNSGGVDIEKGLISGITMCGSWCCKKSLSHTSKLIIFWSVCFIVKNCLSSPSPGFVSLAQ